MKKSIKEMLDLQELTEDEKKSRGILGRLFGPCASITDTTRNGRLYSDELWDNVFNNNDLIKEQFNNGGIAMELDHPIDREETDSTRIAALMPEPPKKDDKGHLICYVDIIDTPCGKIAYQLAKYGYKLGISSRGTGDVRADDTVDPNTYDFTTFDLVLIPAVKDARLSMCESLDTNKLKLTEALKKDYDNCDEDQKKIFKSTINDLDIDVNLDEANYGGAYDIEDNQYFTREELNEFGEYVIDILNTDFHNVELQEIYFENNNIDITVNHEGNEISAIQPVDMRKIRKPKDINKFAEPIVDSLSNQLKELNTDIIKESIDYPNREQVNKIKEKYKPGTRIKLTFMADEAADTKIPEGTCGTVTGVDDIGQLQMKWDNGRTIALIPDIDEFDVIDNINEDLADEVNDVIAEEENSEKNDAKLNNNEVEETTKEEKDIANELTVEKFKEALDNFDSDFIIKINPIIIEGKEYNLDIDSIEDIDNTVNISLVYNPEMDDNINADLPLEDSETNNMEVIDNKSKEIVEYLKESISENKRLKEEIQSLKKLKSVYDVEKSKLNEELEKYKIIIKNKSSSDVFTYKLEIKNLTEKLNNTKTEYRNRESNIRKAFSHKIEEKLNNLTENYNKNIAELKETNSQLSKQLNSYKNKLTESLRENQKLKDSHLIYRANILGINPTEIKNKLNENYSISDIDSVCDNILNTNTSKFNLNKNIKFTKVNDDFKDDDLKDLYELAGLR
jgi:hypothetical protein